MIDPGQASTLIKFYSKVPATGDYSTLIGSARAELIFSEERTVDTGNDQVKHIAKYQFKMYANTGFTILPSYWIKATNPRTNVAEVMKIVSMGDKDFRTQEIIIHAEKWQADQTR